MTPLNIAMLSVHSSPLGELGKKNNGGMSVYILELAAEFEKLGHRIDVFTLQRRPHRREVIALGPRTRLVHLDAGDCEDLKKAQIYGRLEAFFSSMERFRQKQSRRYDLVHSHYWLSGRAGEWAAERWTVPHLMTFHSLGMVKRRVLKVPNEPDLRIDVERRLAAACDSVIVPTRKELENMVAFYGTPRDKMALIPCGVNLTRFRPFGREEARRRLDLPPAPALLLYVGRFTSEKGLERLLHAMPLVEPGFRPHLVIVGGDGDNDEATRRCRAIARRLDIDGRITFAGRIPQETLPVYYSAADLMVLPSLYESFGLVALESLACGTPVVSTPVGALEHVILQGKTGEVVADPGPESLARGVNEVLSRAEDIAREDIRASVRSFDWANVAAALLREYRRLIERRATGAGEASSRDASISAAN